MKKYVGIVLITAMITVGLTACPSTKEVKKPEPAPIEPAPQLAEKLIWSSHQQRPGWTVSEPDTQEGKLFFVGLSGKFAMEKDGRDDAQRHATANVVKYIGTMVQEKFQRISTSYGLSSEIVDPTKAARNFEEQLAQAFATRVKSKEWYSEKWENPKFKESYYLVYLLANVPQSSIEKTYEETCDANIADLKKKRDAANDEKAKAQFENAMKAFEEAKKQGFGLETK
ncbi:MAG: hypothetical protein AAB019_07960 [Planctomycetota bacterium]